MGGYGSGRYRWNVKPLVEGRQRLDVRDLSKQMKKFGEAMYRAKLVMTYEVANEKLSQPLVFTRTPCYFGGWRPWLVCPCGRRVGVLYFKGKEYRCRKCCGLAYTSQNETADIRAIRRAHKIRRLLGGQANSFLPFPHKPKGMHWKTYWVYAKKHSKAQEESWPPWLLKRLDREDLEAALF